MNASEKDLQQINVTTVGRPVSPWGAHAGQWSALGSPLRPSTQDLDVVQQQLCWLPETNANLAVLLLGVTTEIASLTWPSATNVIAVDLSLPILTHRWTPPSNTRCVAVQGDWRKMPLREKSVQLVIGDGALNLLPDALGLRGVLAELARVMVAGARLVTRIFTRLEIESTLDEVVNEMRSGEFSTFHAFKLRALMALHTSDAVILRLVHRKVCDALGDRHAAAKALGWPIDAINTIDSYRDIDSRYFMPRLSQVREFARSSFAEIECAVPSYNVGERCPTWVFARR